MKISIITPTFNSASVINDCIDSVKSQNFKNVEHIIIDGASKDETVSFLNSRRNDFTILISEPDKGIYDAMNKGIKFAKGDIIGFLNSDDIYANNNVLSNVINVFKQYPLIDACYADLIYTDRNDLSKIVRYWKSCKFKKGLFSKGWCPPHPTFFVRSSIYKQFGNFNLNYQIASDVELMMRFLEINKINSMYIPKLWVKMRRGGVSNRSLKNVFKLNREILNALTEHNLSKNFLFFITSKVVSKLKQYFNKH